jgi:hypothetical protein
MIYISNSWQDSSFSRVRDEDLTTHRLRGVMVFETNMGAMTGTFCAKLLQR